MSISKTVRQVSVGAAIVGGVVVVDGVRAVCPIRVESGEVCRAQKHGGAAQGGRTDVIPEYSSAMTATGGSTGDELSDGIVFGDDAQAQVL